MYALVKSREERQVKWVKLTVQENTHCHLMSAETIMDFNEEEETASIYTCSRSLMRKMDRLCVEFPELYTLKRRDEYSKTYEVPKRYFRIDKPQPTGLR